MKGILITQIAVVLGTIALNLALLAGVIWVIVHFVHKFW